MKTSPGPGSQTVSCFLSQAWSRFPQLYGAGCIARHLGGARRRRWSNDLTLSAVSPNVNEPWHLKNALLQGSRVGEAATIVLPVKKDGQMVQTCQNITQLISTIMTTSWLHHNYIMTTSWLHWLHPTLHWERRWPNRAVHEVKRTASVVPRSSSEMVWKLLTRHAPSFFAILR